MHKYLMSPVCWVIFSFCFTLTLALTPVVMHFAGRIGAVDGGGYRRINHKPIPLMGGLAIAIPFFLVCFLGLVGGTDMLDSVSRYSSHFWAIALGGVGIVLVGLYDDIKGMRARSKLGWQVGIACVVVLSGEVITSLSIPFFPKIELRWALGATLTLIWIVGVTNAFNIVDGMDGLSSGLALFGAIAMAIIASIHGMTFAVLLSLALAGSLLAFFNV